MSKFEQMAYGPIGDAVSAAMPTSEADPIGVWAASLSVYSAAISKWVRLDNRRPVVVWTVLVGRSALGRKGYAWNTSTAVLSKVCGGFLHARRRDGIGSGPALVDTLSKLELDTVGENGGIDARAIIVEEEWAAQLKTQKRCNKFSTLFRTAWDGKPLHNRTKKDGLQSVAQPLLGFHGHITPGEWAKYVGGSEALGGSYNRLLPVLVERSKMLPYDSKPEVPDTSEIQEAYEWAQADQRVMRFSIEAGERFDELRAIIEDRMVEMPEGISVYMERAAEQVQRVAAVLSASTKTETISREAVDAAWAFVSYSMNSVEKLVKEAANDGAKPMKSPEDLIRDVLRRNNGKAKSSDLLRPLWGKLNAAMIKDTVAEMRDVIVTEEKSGKRGAPTTWYRLAELDEKPDNKPHLKVIIGQTVTEAKAKSAPTQAVDPMLELMKSLL